MERANELSSSNTNENSQAYQPVHSTLLFNILLLFCLSTSTPLFENNTSLNVKAQSKKMYDSLTLFLMKEKLA